MAATHPSEGDQAPPFPFGLRLTQSPTEQMRSLASLRSVGDHPVFELTWYGEPAHVREASPAPPTDAAVAAPDSDAGFPQVPVGGVLCAALGDPERPLVGRTFDGDTGPALVVRSHPTSGPHSLATLHLHQLGYTRATLDDLRHPRGRQAVLRGEAGLVDGINHHGLFVGLTTDDRASSTAVTDRPRVSGLSVGRLVLDRASTVPEALKVLETVAVDFGGGPGLHYLLVDRRGDSAVVGFRDGQMQVREQPDDQPWRCLAGAATPPEAGEDAEREALCADHLRRAGGRLDPDDVTTLLRQVAGPRTQWSVCYDLAAASLRLWTGPRQGRGTGGHAFSVPE